MLGHVVGKHAGKPRLLKTTISVAHLTAAQRGYLAAFLDGEGGIQITKSLREGRRRRIALHPVVYFTNSNYDAINTVRRWLKAGVVVVRRDRRGYRPCYALHITGIRNITRLLIALSPLLIIKKRQAELMLDFCKSRASFRGENGRRYSPREIRLYRSLKRLNMKHRGKIHANSWVTDKGRKS